MSEAGFDDGPLQRWLVYGMPENRARKYVARKRFAQSVHNLKKDLGKIVRGDPGPQIEVTS